MDYIHQQIVEFNQILMERLHDRYLGRVINQQARGEMLALVAELVEQFPIMKGNVELVMKPQEGAVGIAYPPNFTAIIAYHTIHE